MEDIDRIELQFLAKLRARIKELGINQAELAARMGVSKAYVCKFFSGGGGVTFHSAWKFTKALKLDFIPGIRKRRRKTRAVKG